MLIFLPNEETVAYRRGAPFRYQNPGTTQSRGIVTREEGNTNVSRSLVWTPGTDVSALSTESDAKQPRGLWSAVGMLWGNSSWDLMEAQLQSG